MYDIAERSSLFRTTRRELSSDERINYTAEGIKNTEVDRGNRVGTSLLFLCLNKEFRHCLRQSNNAFVVVFILFRYRDSVLIADEPIGFYSFYRNHVMFNIVVLRPFFLTLRANHHLQDYYLQQTTFSIGSR